MRRDQLAASTARWWTVSATAGPASVSTSATAVSRPAVTSSAASSSRRRSAMVSAASGPVAVTGGWTWSVPGVPAGRVSHSGTGVGPLGSVGSVVGSVGSVVRSTTGSTPPAPVTVRVRRAGWRSTSRSTIPAIRPTADDGTASSMVWVSSASGDSATNSPATRPGVKRPVGAMSAVSAASAVSAVSAASAAAPAAPLSGPSDPSTPPPVRRMVAARAARVGASRTSRGATVHPASRSRATISSAPMLSPPRPSTLSSAVGTPLPGSSTAVRAVTSAARAGSSSPATPSAVAVAAGAAAADAAPPVAAVAAVAAVAVPATAPPSSSAAATSRAACRRSVFPFGVTGSAASATTRCGTRYRGSTRATPRRSSSRSASVNAPAAGTTPAASVSRLPATGTATAAATRPSARNAASMSPGSTRNPRILNWSSIRPVHVTVPSAARTARSPVRYIRAPGARPHSSGTAVNRAAVSPGDAG
ncbi:hypothetical protein MTQ22_06640 [Corynebacterium bovis]